MMPFRMLLLCLLACALQSNAYTRQDSLRGSNYSGRNWWDVQHYELSLRFDTTNQSIAGSCAIRFRVLHTPGGDSLQLDLQGLMFLDSISWSGGPIAFSKEGHLWWLRSPRFRSLQPGSIHTITAYYRGRPKEAVKAPWDGGFVWSRDPAGKPWIGVAVQGLGASAWWPCKDAQWDEPDSGMIIRLDVPSGLKAISNGRLMDQQNTPDGRSHWHWQVHAPINTYNATFYIGDYIHWTDTLMGARGRLDLDYYALRHNESKARKQFEVVKPMLHCFEWWLGPYPFYRDGYKLVESPYLGMEHQSAIAYGNGYKMGYMGTDRSGTGVGMKFDYIIIHESGHEWFGNNITAADLADNWIHEGFTTYTETLFAECLLGRDQAFRFQRGEWHNIQNDRPITGAYGVRQEGSGDRYDKGAAIVHMIRGLMNDDARFRALLRGLNEHFYHKTVSSREVEDYIIAQSGLDLRGFFDQYLRSTDIPVLEWYVKDKKLYYRFTQVVPGFSIPLQLQSGRRKALVKPTAEWQSTNWKRGGFNLSLSPDLLIRLKP